MADWAILRDAYGSAADIPAMIDAWAESPAEDRLNDLWSHLCHQGTVYSASFEAFSLLTEACERLVPKDRRNALMLMAAIWASNDRFDGAAPSAATEQLVPVLRQMTEASLEDGDVDAEEFPYLLQAAASFAGDTFWGRHFDHLAGGEFPGACPECAVELFLAIGKYGYFASTDDYIRMTTSKRNPIFPASVSSMPPDGRWLDERCVRAGQSEAAIGIANIFGTTMCPKCNANISGAEAIRRWFRS